MKLNLSGSSHSKLRILFWTFLVFVTLGCSVSKEPNFSRLDSILSSLNPPMTRFNPARSDWGPGFVFEGDVIDGVIRNISPICENILGDSPFTEANIKLANYTVESDSEFKVSIEFLKNLIKEENSAKLDLSSIRNKEDATIIWSDTKNQYYRLEDIFLNSGEPRPIPVKCISAINLLKDRGKYEKRVFIILSTISATKFKYEFNEEKISKIGIDTNIADTLTGVAGVDFSSKGKTDLEISGEKLFIGYAKPVLVVNWIPSGLISGDQFSVDVEPVNYTLENY